MPDPTKPEQDAAEALLDTLTEMPFGIDPEGAVEVIAAALRRAEARGLREAAGDFASCTIRSWLRARADRLEREALEGG